MERIEITPELMSEFIAFTKQDGVVLLKEESLPTGQVLKTYNTNQEFILPKYDPLIYGKDDTEHIVSIEHDGVDGVVLYKEPKPGVIETEYRKHNLWLLSNRAILEQSQYLQGRQFYKTLTECNNRGEFQHLKVILKKKHIDYWTANDLKENYMLRSGVTYFKNLQPRNISILSFDIETSGVNLNEESQVYLISNTYRCGDKIIRRIFDIFDYHCRQENMIQDWCDWVNKLNPSLMVGHNCVGFDLKFLDHCSDGGLNIGRNGSKLWFNDYTSSFRKDGSQSYDYNKAFIHGREIVDTWMLSIKYDIGRKYESYSLKQIIRQEGLEKSDRSFVDASQIKNVFYRIVASNYKDQEALEEWKKIRAYAEDDSDDALKLFDLMSPALFYFTQTVPKSFQNMIETATGSQVNSLMVRSYLQFNKSIAKATEANKFDGAISLGLPGIYKNCVRWDIASLYPSIMRQYKIFDKHKDPEKNFLYILEYFTLNRLKNKKLAKETNSVYYKDLEQSQKIAINSKYGFLGAPGLNYNYPYGAAKVTEYGRKILTDAVKWASGKDIKDLNVDQISEDNSEE